MATHSESTGEAWSDISKTELIAYNADMALRIGEMRKCFESLNLGCDKQDAQQKHLQREIERLSETMQQQATEIEALTRMLEEHPVAQYVADLEKYAEWLEFNYLSMTSSTSWKATSPLRAAARIMFGKESPPQFKPKFYRVRQKP